MANPFDEIDPPAKQVAAASAGPASNATPASKNPFDEIDPPSKAAAMSASPAADSELNWSDVPAKALENAPTSAVNFGKALVEPVLHPIDTVQNLGRLALGTVEKFLPGDWEHEKYADAVGKHFMDRYGSEAGFKKAIAEDPVGVLSDMSVVLGGVGGLTSKAGQLSNLSKVARTGEVVGNVGRAIDPVMAPINAAKVGSEVIGGIGTHTGAGPLREAFNAGVEGGERGKVFREEMRGASDMSDVVDTARQGMAGLYREKADQYMRDMSPVNSDYHMLDFDRVDKALANVGDVKKFKGVDINRKTAGIRKEITDLVDEWRGYAPAQYHTPAGFDALKQALGDIMDHTEIGSPARRVAREAYNAVKQEIVSQAPQYAKAMKNYENAMGMIREMEHTLSLKQGANIDTTLRKLQSIMRNNVNANYGRRMELGKMLEEAGAENLMSRLAGQTLNTWTPRGLGKAAAEIGLLGAGAHAAAFPWAAAALPAMSPRLMGEASHLAGRTAGRGLNKTNEMLGKIGLTNRAGADAAYEIGRISDEEKSRPRVVMDTTNWGKSHGGPVNRADGGAVHNHSPTEAQKKAGNYAKTHRYFHGLDITIENLRGKSRSGIGKDGKEWSVKMPAHYGYIKRTEGADGDHVDVYLGPNEKSDQVFVVDQKDAETGKFDEHKCLLGFNSEAEARKTYRAGFSDGKDRIKHLRRMSMAEFKDWLAKGDTSKEIRRYASGGAVRRALQSLKSYADGGAPDEDIPFDPMSGVRIGADTERTEREAAPNRFARATIQAIGGIPHSMMTLPGRAFDSAREMAETGTYDPAPIIEAAMLPMGTGAIAGVAARPAEMVLGSGPVRGIRAYHGSPHDFDRFDLSKIGTGEGAQAYGHGLYFAENEGVARGYRDTLSKRAAQDPAYWTDAKLPSSLSVPEQDELNWLGAAMRKSGNLPADEMGRWRTLKDKQRAYDDAIEAAKPKGSMYEVNINADPAHFLDWNRPLNRQSQEVVSALQQAMRPSQWKEFHPADAGTAMKQGFIGLDERIASEKLRDAGLPGIKYLDQGSRFNPAALPNNPIANEARQFLSNANGDSRAALKAFNESNPIEKWASSERDEIRKVIEAGGVKPTSNFVVFDDKLIDILRKYGIAGLPAAGIAAGANRGDE